jgi:hypothetical protein
MTFHLDTAGASGSLAEGPRSHRTPGNLGHARSWLALPPAPRSGSEREPHGSGVYGRFHRWLALPVQSQICNWVPGVVEKFVSSRHLFDCGL